MRHSTRLPQADRALLQRLSLTWNQIMDAMNVDPNTVRKLREERAWSQEHLAAVAGLSLRTVQRVESDANASAETRMALATAFGVDLQGLKPAAPALDEAQPAAPLYDPPAAFSDRPASVKNLPYLYYRLLRFVVIVGLFVGLDVCETGSVTWSRWVVVFGIALFGLRMIRPRFGEREEGRRRSGAR